MDDAALDLGLWKHGPNGFPESCKAVHAKQQHILYAPVLQVIQHSHPEPGALIGSYRDAEDLFVAFRRDA